MKNFLYFTCAVLICFFISNSSHASYLYNFNSGVPPEFSIGGNGFFSQSSNSTIFPNTLEITTSRGSGPNYAGSSITLSDPISSISFSIYDQYAGNAPFYMYFGLGPAMLAWQDAGLSDNVLIYGGNSVPTPRSVGWHTVDAQINENVITFLYNGSLLGNYTSATPLNITNTGWTVDSAGGGTYSMFIDDISIQTTSNSPVVTWSPAQNISGDSDVSTLGTLIYAYNIGENGQSTPPAVTSTTVNGVSFSAFAFPENYTTNNVTIGDLTITEDPSQLWAWNELGYNSGAIAGLSAGYQSLLGSGGSAGAPGTMTIKLGGLTLGQDYLVQWWSNDSAMLSGGSVFSQTSAIGNPSNVTLDSNTSNTVGALGQYVIGTFTAISPFASFDLNGTGGYPLINAIQVRNITSAAVPEPGRVAASILLLAGIGGYVWLKRRKPAKSEAPAA